MSADTLIFIPTFNERENVAQMVGRLEALPLEADILFLDDASPDGTGDLLDAMARERSGFHVLHRPGKLGIGGAHLDGIRWAYDRGYSRLVTLDCDFSHSPEDIPRFLASLKNRDVVLGSRFLQQGSLPGWNALRRALTWFGHLLTERLLEMPQDATGAFRAYNLSTVPRNLWDLVRSRGYSFFFESCFLFGWNGLRIEELPIVLPARTYGHSKMSLREAFRSGLRVWKLWLQTVFAPEQFAIERAAAEIDPRLSDPQHWDRYWSSKKRASLRTYDLIATLYRNLVIRRQLNRHVRKVFRPGSKLLHAGCGSGQVDAEIGRKMRISAVDISPEALALYARNNPRAHEVLHASIFDLPFADGSFDGAYNLGVLEHFTASEIEQILRELARVVEPGGKLLIFWPHERASSVLVLRGARFVLRRIFGKDVEFHPEEISRIRCRAAAARYFESAGWRLESYEFGIRDLFVQVALVAAKAEPLSET